jgi:hypothetical protein
LCSRLNQMGEHMPNFYFHLKYADRIWKDNEGSDFPNLSAAKREAQLTARDILIEAVRSRVKKVPHALVISDDEGRTVHTMPIGAVLPAPLTKQ